MVARAAVVLLVLRGEAAKPRPAVVIQQDLPSLSGLSTIVVAPCTPVLEGLSLRPLLRPSPANGLHQPFTVMVDRLQAAGRDRIRDSLGMLSNEEMIEVDAALMLVLGLGVGVTPSRSPG